MFKPVALLVLFATVALAADPIVGGPFVVNVTPTAATVVWITQSGETTIGTTEGSLDRMAPALHAANSSFTGLKPGTTYYYDVNGTAEGKGSFKTPPADAKAFDFVVYGDTRTRHDMHRRIVAAVVKSGKPDFVLHTGDLVENGLDTAQWPLFFGIERELLRETVFFPSLGNHERNNRQFYEFFQIGPPYYSFNWGKNHFIVLNSDIGNAGVDSAMKETFWAQQKHWLEEDLAKNQSAEFRFVIAHHPPITAVSRRQGSNPEMTALIPLFEKYKLTAGFFGHDHNYQHYLKDGIHYVVTGGGGAPLYDVDKPAAGITVKAVSTEHFVKIHVEGGVVKVTAIALDGRTLDEFEMKGR
ncbi:MAG TPA: metallophosphoesterase [Bryobacteraceae bacterium]|nr:metallophosphoesterase [Bryobacteraceae bacterium]